MIYGAPGYTGRLVARTALERGFQPILAGRNEGRVARLAADLQLPYRVFTLDDPAEAAISLEGVGVVLNCAGPFTATARPLARACMAARCNYLDITGEIAVFEELLALDREARQARILIVPGVGFDVVPTDCLAAMLAARMPDATHLDLAIYGLGQTSPGTSRTMLARLPEGGFERIGGLIRSMPLGRQERTADFSDGPRRVFSVPWGDVSTAYHTTGIPNITTYFVMPAWQGFALKWARPVQAALRMGPVQTLARIGIALFIKGPDERARQSGHCEIWGQVRSASGDTLTGRLRTPDGYAFTVDAALSAVQRVLEGGLEPGAYTPARLFGADFVLACAGTVLEDFQLRHEGDLRGPTQTPPRRGVAVPPDPQRSSPIVGR